MASARLPEGGGTFRPPSVRSVPASTQVALCAVTCARSNYALHRVNDEDPQEVRPRRYTAPARHSARSYTVGRIACRGGYPLARSPPEHSSAWPRTPLAIGPSAGGAQERSKPSPTLQITATP